MKRLCAYCLLFFLVAFQQSWAADIHDTALTLEEQAWIRQHPVIRVSNELEWPPINFVKNGKPTGFSVEYIKLVAEKVGIRLEFVPGNSSDLLQKAYDKELDVMLNIVRNKQRAKHLLFTKPYASTPTAIFSRIEDRHLRSIEDLVGKKVAVVKDFYTHRYLKEHYPSIELLPILSTLEGITALSTGRADAMLDRLAVGNYVIATNFITNVSPSGTTGIAVLDKAEWRLGVRNDWPELISILQKGMDRVGREEYAALLNRWYLYGAPITQPRGELTEEERVWLKRHAPFRVGVDPDYAPYDYVDEYGRHQGIAADYMQLLSERLGVDLNVVPGLSWEQVMDQAREKKLDVVAAVTKTPERSRFLRFSRPINFLRQWSLLKGRPNITIF